MSRDALNNMAVVQFRSGSDQGTAVTADATGTALTDDRLRGLVTGVLLVTVEAADDSDGDETYVFTLQGSNDGGSNYSDICTLTVTAGTAKVYAVSAPQLGYEYLRLNLDVGGTTPSITYGATLLATELRYKPDVGTVISS